MPRPVSFEIPLTDFAVRMRPAEVRALVRGNPRHSRLARLVTLFVASPGDVSEERDRVRAAVDRVHQLIGPALRFEVVRWEDHAAPDWQRPQTVVFRNTSFAEIELFVGIFWARMGTPTGAVDPSRGVEYESGTLEELEAARRLHEQGQVRRIMLYFREPQPTPRTPDEERQAEAVRRLKARLQAGPERGLCSMYPDPDAFEELLVKHLVHVARGILPEERAREAVYDDFIVKLCDRINQDRDFGDFFADGLSNHCGRPQACIVWGERSEAHDSFRERILATRVRMNAEERWTEPAIVDRRVDWPDDAGGGDLRRQLAQGLVEEFRYPAPHGSYTAAELTALAEYRGAHLVVLHHDLFVDRWSGAAKSLLQWYLDQYWAELPPDPGRPEVLVLLKVVCQPGLDAGGRDAMKRDLEALSASGSSGCRRILLPELTPITQKDVERWLRRHSRQLSERRLLDLAAWVFRVDDSAATVPSLSMVDAEVRLLALVRELQRQANTGGEPADDKE